jgi:methylase of polypeptide subunit release factors
MDWPDARAYVSPISFFDPPSYFAENLCKTIPPKSGNRRLLDVGCGSVIIGIYCLIEGKADFVTFSDIQCQAIAESCANFVRHVELKKLRVEQAAFMEHCPFQRISREIVVEHELVVFNPPQIPEKYLNPETVKKRRPIWPRRIFDWGGATG